MNSQSLGFASEEMLDLSRDAVLVKVKISQIGVTANSKILSREAADKHKADKNSTKGYVQKIKWTDLSDLTRIYNEARELLNRNTLPWSEEWRCCPVVNYNELTKAMRELENRFSDGVTKLIANHGKLEKDYVTRVGEVLANEIPFPSKKKMQESFSFKFEETLIPSTDIRLRHVSEDERLKIAERAQRNQTNQIREAQKELVQRISTAVQRIAQGVSEDGKLHESAVEALNQTLEVIPSLNVAKDSDITAMVDRVKKQLGDLDVKDLRKDPAAKVAVGAAASSILDDLKGFGKK